MIYWETCFVLILMVVQVRCLTLAEVKPPIVQPLQPVKPVVPDQELLESVFGKPGTQDAVDKLTDDIEYWDINEDFQPSKLDYDSFDWGFAKIIGSGTLDNVVVSPLGVKLLLAILREAATGTTESEIGVALGLNANRTLVRNKFTEILNSLKVNSEKFILNLGNRVYVSNGTQLRQKFQSIAETYYKTDIMSIDFKTPPLAVKEINMWVFNLTEGRIPMLVNENDLSNAVMVLVNTIFFKGAWRHQFHPNSTKARNFYLENDKSISLPFMSVTNRFFCAESTTYDAKILRMPYQGSKFAMYLVVPNAINGLQKLFNNFDYSRLKNELFFLKERVVDVVLPKFKFDFSAHLNSVLYQMGIRQAFQDTASFPGLSSVQLLQERLQISKVLQKSGIEVNELGSVAYSATDIVLVNKFGEDDAFNEVLANRPFMFFIEDETTRQLLFVGKVTNPTQPEGLYPGDVTASTPAPANTPVTPSANSPAIPQTTTPAAVKL